MPRPTSPSRGTSCISIRRTRPSAAPASFTSYTGPRFHARDQERLQQLVVSLACRGCFVMVSNSTAEEIAALYERNADARAADCARVASRRGAPSTATPRGAARSKNS
jgi:site-specific DNA-adenine methylase